VCLSFYLRFGFWRTAEGQFTLKCLRQNFIHVINKDDIHLIERLLGTSTISFRCGWVKGPFLCPRGWQPALFHGRRQSAALSLAEYSPVIATIMLNWQAEHRRSEGGGQRDYPRWVRPWGWTLPEHARWMSTSSKKVLRDVERELLLTSGS
jgi:hypothetical protein